MPKPVTIPRLDWTDLELGVIDLPARTLRLTRSLTSGLTRNPRDAEGVFWGVGDRGPNLKPATALGMYGLAAMTPHLEAKGAKMFPMPSVGPSLARFRLVGNRIELEVVVALRAPSGKALSGLPAPSAPEAETEPALALDGSLLYCRVDGADTEGIAALPASIRRIHLLTKKGCKCL